MVWFRPRAAGLHCICKFGGLLQLLTARFDRSLQRRDTSAVGVEADVPQPSPT